MVKTENSRRINLSFTLSLDRGVLTAKAANGSTRVIPDKMIGFSEIECAAAKIHEYLYKEHLEKVVVISTDNASDDNSHNGTIALASEVAYTHLRQLCALNRPIRQLK